jgi:hypothetical protein
MQITNSSNQTPANSFDNKPAPTQRVDGAASGVGAAHLSGLSGNSPAEQSSGLVLSFDWLSLGERLQQLPPVRADVVAEAANRLATGQLGTADAIGRTAQAILGS